MNPELFFHHASAAKDGQRIKRVRTLYRVSTKSQVHGDDIPVQRKACRDYINLQESWQLEYEYTEKGISAFRRTNEQRDVLHQIRLDAIAGKFDILVVFLQDRIGRSVEETPSLLRDLSKAGVEVWSAHEGLLNSETHIDELMTMMRAWLAEGESLKTSVRVTEAHAQMVQAGKFRGGTAPYGYRLVRTDEESNAGKLLFDLAICHQDAEIVKMVFRLSSEEQMGGKRIANYLNAKGVPTRTGSPWTMSTVNYMLRNPIYKGYMVYGKSTKVSGSTSRVDPSQWVLADKQRPELVIVSEDKWDEVQSMRNSRMNNEDDGVHRIDSASSPLLLVGIARCGYCGSPLNTTYDYKSWTLKDGTRKKVQRNKYRCQGKHQGGNSACDGQTMYAQKRLEEAALKQVYDYIKFLKQIDVPGEIARLEARMELGSLAEVTSLEFQLKQCYQVLSALNDELTTALLGESLFTKDLLAKHIAKIEAEMAELQSAIETANRVLKEQQKEITNLVTLQRYIPSWTEEFAKSARAEKKMMLSLIIKELRVWTDRIEIDYSVACDQFRAWAK